MAKEQCPVLLDISNEDQCLENFAGLGTVGYFFMKDDIDKSKLVANKNVYAWAEDTFKEGKGFFRVELKTGSQSFSGASLGQNKGFSITGQQIIQVVNEKVAQFCRALNNTDWGLVIADGESGWQILYSPTYKVTMDANAVQTATGSQASDDRVTTLAPVLQPVKYPNLFVEFPEGKTPEDFLQKDAA